MVEVSRKLGRKYRTNWVLNLTPVVCESITLTARPQLLRSSGYPGTPPPNILLHFPKRLLRFKLYLHAVNDIFLKSSNNELI